MNKKAKEIQLDIDLGLTLDGSHNVLIRRFLTNDWPADLLMDVLAAISVRIKSFYGSVQHPNCVLEEADFQFNELIAQDPEFWDESDRTAFKLNYVHHRYDDLYQKVDGYQCEISRLRDIKGIDD